MLKRLTSIGKRKGLILDKTLLGLLGIEDAEQVSLTVEGRRLIVEPVYENPIASIRARLRDQPENGAVDRRINAAVKKVRADTVRKLKAKRAQ